MQRTCLCAHLLRTLTLKCKGAAEIHHMAGAIYASSLSFIPSGSELLKPERPREAAEKHHFWFREMQMNNKKE